MKSVGHPVLAYYMNGFEISSFWAKEKKSVTQPGDKYLQRQNINLITEI